MSVKKHSWIFTSHFSKTPISRPLGLLRQSGPRHSREPPALQKKARWVFRRQTGSARRYPVLKAKSGKVLLRPGEAGQFNSLNNPGASPSLTATRSSDERRDDIGAPRRGHRDLWIAGVDSCDWAYNVMDGPTLSLFNKNMLKNEIVELLVPR